MGQSFYAGKCVPFIIEKDGIIQEVSDSFLKFMEYEKNELNNKYISEVWSNLLRISTDINLINADTEVILFTKALEVRFVTVSKTEDIEKHEITYEFAEKPDSRLENKMAFVEKLYSDEKLGVAIYDTENLNLLKANKIYLDYVPKPFNTKELSYGKSMKEIFPGFENGHGEREVRKIIESNKTKYITEMQGLWCGSDDRYWDNTIAPIAEDGQVKYLVSILKDVTERVLGREHIRIKNEQLEAIINSVSDIICITDKYGNYISGNELSRQLYNLYQENKKSPKKYIRIFDDAGKELDLNQVNCSLVFNGEEIERIKVNIELNGKERYFKFSGKPIWGKNNYIEYGIFVLHDITGEIKRIKTIERQNRVLKAVIDNSYNCICVIDNKGYYIQKNKAFKEMFEDEADGINIIKKAGDTIKNGYKYYYSNGDEIALQDIPSFCVLRGENIKKQRIIIKNGLEKKYTDIDGIPIYDENGKFEMGIVINHDITELMQSYGQIESQKKDLDTIINNMNDGLFVIDKDANIIKCNKAFEDVSRKLFHAENIFEHVGGPSRYGWKHYDEDGRELSTGNGPFGKVLKGEVVKQQRFMSIKGNIKIYVDLSCTPILDENGSFQYGIVIGHDVTEVTEKENKIKEQQELLYKSERSKREILEKTLIMKDEFISLISHEFKTPINVIYSAIQLIEYMYSNELSQRVKELIKSIKQNTFRELRLVNNLLDITRLNSGRLKLNMKNVDIVLLTKMIVESIRLYVEQKNIKLSFKTNVISKIIAADDEKYERIILNLISNAIKFTSEGGHISVNIEEDELLNTVVISVTDTGIGIPKEKQKIIFERFGQVESSLSRQAEGTGIGLSLVKLLVDAFGGEIIVKSELGMGSTFEVTLPAEQCIEDEQNCSCLDADSRLINAVNVEFSDIYF